MMNLEMTVSASFQFAVCRYSHLALLGLATGDDGGSIPSAAIPPAAGVEAATAPDADVAVAAKTATKPLTFKLDRPEGIAAFVAWALQPHASTGTMAFHWKTWGNGVDKKVCQL
jgi:hypothetical protein